MYKKRKENILILCLIIICLSFLGNRFYQHLDTKKDRIEVEAKSISKQKTVDKNYNINSNQKRIVVHIGGAVVKPGVYKCAEKSRLYKVLKKAGGPTSKADLDAVNLAFEIKDGEKIIIPSYKDSNSAASAKININQAQQDQLEEIAGIGPVTAKKIIDYRKKQGRFRKLSNLTDVSGIGPKTLTKIKDKITY